MIDGDYPGEERRAIPSHILKYIDQRVEGSLIITNGQFIELRTQIRELTNSITSWMDKEPDAIAERCEQIMDEAIPTSPDNSDATPAEKRKEHRHAHAKWMQDVADEMNRWKRIREKVIEWGVISGLGFVGLAVVHYTLEKYK
jgi:hypothetical protein